jgi:hypothetical protein
MIEIIINKIPKVIANSYGILIAISILNSSENHHYLFFRKSKQNKCIGKSNKKQTYHRKLREMLLFRLLQQTI